MKRRIVLLIAVVCVAFAIYDVATNNVDDIFGGADNVAVIAKPDSVKAWRTVGTSSDESLSPADYYRKAGDGVIVPPALAANLSKVLRNRRIYPRDSTHHVKLCVPTPGVIVTFTKAGEDIDVFFCFECNILSAGEHPHGDDKAVRGTGGADFDSAHDRLVGMMKEIFPKDVKIQSLR